MSTYESVPTTIEAMQWPTNGGNDRFQQGLAEQIVAWVNAYGGEAAYFTASRSARAGFPSEPRIAIHTINGWAYAAPGHYVVMGTAEFNADLGPGITKHVRDFYPCDPETFAKRWRPKND